MSKKRGGVPLKGVGVGDTPMLTMNLAITLTVILFTDVNVLAVNLKYDLATDWLLITTFDVIRR